LRGPRLTAPRPPPPEPLLREGPTDALPALHLIFSYPRDAATMTGEQLRRELLRRMEGRAGEAA
jgi:hypothetical protein